MKYYNFHLTYDKNYIKVKADNFIVGKALYVEIVTTVIFETDCNIIGIKITVLSK